MRKIFKRCLNDDSGATAVEYALIASLISIGLVVFVPPVADALIDIFTGVAAALPSS
jgi:pilus assembly protein Flp/PilA